MDDKHEQIIRVWGKWNQHLRLAKWPKKHPVQIKNWWSPWRQPVNQALCFFLSAFSMAWLPNTYIMSYLLTKETASHQTCVKMCLRDIDLQTATENGMCWWKIVLEKLRKTLWGGAPPPLYVWGLTSLHLFKNFFMDSVLTKNSDRQSCQSCLLSKLLGFIGEMEWKPWKSCQKEVESCQMCSDSTKTSKLLHI